MSDGTTEYLAGVGRFPEFLVCRPVRQFEYRITLAMSVENTGETKVAVVVVSLRS